MLFKQMLFELTLFKQMLFKLRTNVIRAIDPSHLVRQIFQSLNLRRFASFLLEAKKSNSDKKN